MFALGSFAVAIEVTYSQADFAVNWIMHAYIQDHDFNAKVQLIPPQIMEKGCCQRRND